MQKAFCLFIFLVILLGFNNANSQGISVFNCDASTFPTVRAKFFAFDGAGKQITNLSPSDFLVTENGIPRTVTNVSCPEPKPMQIVSIAMSIDISGSMSDRLNGESPIELGKKTAKELCSYIAMPPNEFALQACDDVARIMQDFTTNKSKLLSQIDKIPPGWANDFVEQLLNPLTGLLNIAKFGKNKRVALIYTDAYWPAMPSNEIQSCIDTCAKYNIQFFAIIYSNSNTEPNGIKKSLQLLADASGGCLYDGITSSKATADVANRIQSYAQGGDPCAIEWLSDVPCVPIMTNLQVKLISNNSTSTTGYYSPETKIAKLEFSPEYAKFLYTPPGIPKETTITVTAINSNFNVSNITSSNPAFTINPTNFYLKTGQSRDLTMVFLPLDSSYIYSKFIFENDKCPTFFSACGGFPGKKPKTTLLKLIKPNGGEVFSTGVDTLITWEGVAPDEKVKIEYSINNGIDWLPITNNATGLSYKWLIPNTPSNKCLIKVTANGGIPEVKICNQVWMNYNLDVDCYRNGEPIPEVQDSTEWVNLTTGAWCNFDNDPQNGAIYGKLYNQYAVRDPRGLAPEGWKIPSKGYSLDPGDWYQLFDCLGGEDVAGGKLKTTGTKEVGDGLWLEPNTGATNESGFSALPGGFRDDRGLFTGDISLGGYWWATDGAVALNYHSAGITNSFGKKYTGASVRCIKDTSESYYQFDESDAVFSIVAPKANSKDVDMGKCALGSYKDSLITDFISNFDDYKFRVDSIYFTGPDADAFKLVSGFPKYEINPGESKAAEFEFIPNRIGIHNAIINIKTPSDSLKQNIQGEGVEKKIEIISKLLDFGLVELGKEKTFQDTALIKNVSSSALNIINVVQLGPDKKQFEILSGGGAFTLQPNETRKLTVRFKPVYVGRTSGQLGFEFNDVGSPAIVQLFGHGDGELVVKIENDSAYAGEARSLKIVMSNAKLETIAAIAPNFEAKIRFQKTILTPIKKSERTVINDSIYMNIKGTFGTTLELAQIPVIAGLGNVGETTIDIVDFVLKDNSDNTVDFEIETTPGLFKLLGICNEGGTRLFNPSGKVEIMQINPNPASDDIEINVNLIEDGATTLSIFNSNGFKIKEFNMSDETGLKTIKLDIRDYSNGLYFIQLQTPTVLENQKLMIIK